MQYLPMSILEYRFDENGNTRTIVVAFQVFQGEYQFNARIPLTQENVAEINPNLELDRMNKEQADTIARRILRDWTMVEPSEDDIVEGNEDGDPVGNIPDDENGPIV